MINGTNVNLPESSARLWLALESTCRNAPTRLDRSVLDVASQVGFACPLRLGVLLFLYTVHSSSVYAIPRSLPHLFAFFLAVPTAKAAPLF